MTLIQSLRCAALFALLAQAAPTDSSAKAFDYVIVGGGTAGLTVASRLSEDPTVSVAVIEAGDFYEKITGNFSQIPSDDVYYNTKSPEDTGPEDWGFDTVPQVAVGGGIFHYARGKTLGGSSALNFMGYQHTTKGAMAAWAKDVDDDSWTYDNIEQYYTKSNSFQPPNMEKRIANSTPEYDASTLGTGGPLSVNYPNYAQAWSTWVALALSQLGLHNIPGFTTGSLFGHGWLIETINATTGYRASSEAAFLRPYLHRPNLHVYTNSLAKKVLFTGQQASGVRLMQNTSSAMTTFDLTARKEVIVSAGVFQSPQLLMVSGVGPADLLHQYGIDVVADRPGVGQNMNDHIFYGISYRVNVQTLTALFDPAAHARAVQQFDTNADGLLASPGGDYAGYENIPAKYSAGWSDEVRANLSRFPSDWPQIEYFSLPGFVGNFTLLPQGYPNDGYQHATIMATSIAPIARGSVSISSADTADHPLIDPNWLSTDTDKQVAIAAFKRLRDILTTPVMGNVTIGEENYPGPSVQTDDQIWAQVQRSFNAMYHASCTCKMGTSADPMAVVDSNAKVFGVTGLRVVDASAFPFLPPGLPMGTVYMLAEKISDAIKHGK